MMFLKFVRTFFDFCVRDSFGDEDEQAVLAKRCHSSGFNFKLYQYVLRQQCLLSGSATTA